jgi:hypothetical protein
VLLVVVTVEALVVDADVTEVIDVADVVEPVVGSDDVDPLVSLDVDVVSSSPVDVEPAPAESAFPP